jgi:hypothetical protein
MALAWNARGDGALPLTCSNCQTGGKSKTSSSQSIHLALLDASLTAGRGAPKQRKLALESAQQANGLKRELNFFCFLR